MNGESARSVITVVTVDDHPLIRAGLEAVIGDEDDMRLVAEASNGEEALELYRQHRPDVLLMDLRMPLMDGLSAMRAILGEFPDAKVVVLSTYDGDEDIYRALEAGARGYLLKDMLRRDVITVIRSVYGGQRGIPPQVASRLAEYTPRIALTTREMEILQLAAKGFGNREIASIIGRAEGTVKVHFQNILEKLGAGDRTEAVTTALQRGFIHLD